MAQGAVEELQDQIYKILYRDGPRCSSELSTMLVAPLAVIHDLLERLEAQGLIVKRGESPLLDTSQIPWGLPTFSRRSK